MVNSDPHKLITCRVLLHVLRSVTSYNLGLRNYVEADIVEVCMRLGA